MLCELRIENLLLIERAQLEPASGLNVLTGETGAGKTVLAHALDLLMGGRPRSGIVRPGAQEAYVEGVFALSGELAEQVSHALPENAQGESEELVLARRVGADGRTRAYVNGRSASVGDLRELGGRIVSFYGQHEHRKLMLASAQLDLLDRICAGLHPAALRACGEAYRETQSLRCELARSQELAAMRERELELLEHEIAEIEQAAPAEQEYERLLQSRERLRRIDALHAAAGGAAEALAGEGGGAAQLAAQAAAGIGTLAGIDGRLDALGARCDALAIEAQDVAVELRGYAEQLQEQDGSLQEVEERLDVLERLIRKHGGTIAAVLAHHVDARARRDELLGAQAGAQETAARLAQAEAQLREHVETLHEERVRAAQVLASGVREELAALAMPDATFKVRVERTEPKASGADAVEFMIAPNPGVAAAPLRESASGGELSRVMLALTAVCGRSSRSGAAWGSTLVFDEIDAGIGGHTARAVGERLRELAQGRQVLCITHLPQIASLADRHFSIVKDTSGEPTSTSVVQLGGKEVVSELVRMLGADERDAGANKHARELLEAA